MALEPSWVLLRKLWRVGGIYFKGDRKRRAISLLALVIVLCAACVGLSVVISYIQRDLSTALSNKNVDAFHTAIWKFIGVVVVAVPMFALFKYYQELISIEWRVWLSELLLNSYFTDRAYFDLKMDGKLDNPDQRICEDVSNFVQNAVDILAIVSRKLLNIFAFTGVLWYIAPELVFFLLGYAFLGTFVTVRLFGKRIMQLKFQSLQREADFRYSLVRVRENAESIAFYRGEIHEASSVKKFFSSLVSNISKLIVWDRHLAFFSNAYEFSILIVPSLIIAPRFFAGEVEFGVIPQSAMAFQRIFSSLSFIILKFDRFSGLAAQTERLDSLLLALGTHNSDARLLGAPRRQSSGKRGIRLHIQETNEGQELLDLNLVSGTISREEGRGLVISHLSVVTPNLQTDLIQDLNFELAPGQSVLVLGPSGCGKSSLLRAFAGLWNKGTGLIQMPPLEKTLFLPQKPYMPLGTLRQQLMFPVMKNASTQPADTDLLKLLEEVCLGDLVQKVGGLDAVCDWSDMLSSGEQQRVAFARLLLHQPQMAFLDEASSALDRTNESRLYALVQQRVESYVSVGHRTSLVKFHTNVLEFVEGSGWTWYSRQEFQSLRPDL